MQKNEFELIDLAVGGDKQSLETLLINVQDAVYNLALRMLGDIHDAEDATQEIIMKIIKHLSDFRKECAFLTWVYRIAVNYLISCKKSMFAKRSLSFELYGDDIKRGFVENSSELLQNVEENILADELKLSCTNVLLQCLDAQSRCIYVLGTMFKADSRTAGEILGISAELYRQKLSRIRKKVGGFLSTYCGLAGGSCDCKKRVGYAIISQRLNPSNLEYSKLELLKEKELFEYKDAMESLDAQSIIYANMPKYRTPKNAKAFLIKLIQSENMQVIMENR